MQTNVEKSKVKTFRPRSFKGKITECLNVSYFDFSEDRRTDCSACEHMIQLRIVAR